MVNTAISRILNSHSTTRHKPFQDTNLLCMSISIIYNIHFIIYTIYRGSLECEKLLQGFLQGVKAGYHWVDIYKVWYKALTECVTSKDAGCKVDHSFLVHLSWDLFHESLDSLCCYVLAFWWRSNALIWVGCHMVLSNVNV